MDRAPKMASAPGSGSILVSDPALIAELVDVAELSSIRAGATRCTTWGHGGWGNRVG